MPPPITANLVHRITARVGTNTTVDGAAISSFTEPQTGTVYSGSGSTRPTYIANGRNGWPVMRFAGGQYLVAPGVVAALNQNYWTIYAFYKKVSDAGVHRRAWSNEDVPGFKGYGIGLDHNDRYRIYYGTGTANTELISTYPTNDFHLAVAEYDSSGTNVSGSLKTGLYLDDVSQDGAVVTLSAQSKFAPAIGTVASSVGTLTFVGDIADIYIYAGSTNAAAHTMAQRASMYAYIINDWAASTGYSLSCTVGSVGLTGQSTILRDQRSMKSAPGVFALGGSNAQLRSMPKLATAGGSFAMAGQSANVVASRRITGAMAAFAVAGQAVPLRTGRGMAVDAAFYRVDGGSINARSMRGIALESALFSLAGANGTTTRVLQLIADVATFDVSPSSALFSRQLRYGAGIGEFAIIGRSATITYRPIAPIGALIVRIVRVALLGTTPRVGATSRPVFVRTVSTPIVVKSVSNL